MTVEQALAYIHSVSWKGSIPGLSRTRELLEKMGNPEKKLKFVHIAGTNGKGSTAAMLASIFSAAGYKTGLYTSPYLFRFNERMQVNGVQIADDELVELVQYVRPLADACSEAPTEFELVTCIGMEFFRRHSCDVVVLEAGMGGELDSTNVIDTPVCAILCAIGLDHTRELGATLPEIARTKAGIFKPGGLCITYPSTLAVEAIYSELAQLRDLHWHRVDPSRLRERGHDLDGQRFDFGEYRNLSLPLLGNHQLCNAAVALTAVEQLVRRGWKITPQHVHDGLAAVSWPGRFELLCKKPLFIADGGHNPQCMRALANNLNLYLPERKIVFLTGVMADKDYARMYDSIAPFASRFIAVTPDNPRALPANMLAGFLSRYQKPVAAAPSIREGVSMALECVGKDEAIVAAGSLYMLGEIRALAQNW